MYTGFLPQDLDENSTKILHAHRFSRVGMRQEGLVCLRLALDLRAGGHAHERDQIIGRCGGKKGFVASSIVIARRGTGTDDKNV